MGRSVKGAAHRISPGELIGLAARPAILAARLTVADCLGGRVHTRIRRIHVRAGKLSLALGRRPAFSLWP